METTEGQGTTFIMSSLGYRGTPCNDAQETSEQRLRVLLMDDEETILEVGRELLEANGFSGGDGKRWQGCHRTFIWRRVAREGFDVVIMDLTIRGGMGGKEAIVELLKLDPKAVAIVSSGYSNDPVMAEYRKFGFSGRGPETVSDQDMVEMIRSVTDQGQRP